MSPARQADSTGRTDEIASESPRRFTLYDVMTLIAFLAIVLAGRHNTNVADLLLFATYGLVPGLLMPVYLVGRTSGRVHARAWVDLLMVGVPVGLVAYLLFLMVGDFWAFDPERWGRLLYLPAPAVTLIILVLVRSWPRWLEPADRRAEGASESR